MKKTGTILFLILFAVAVLAACGSQKAEPGQTGTAAAHVLPETSPQIVPSQEIEQAPVRIRVFQTSDIHGYLTDTSSGDESTFQYRLAFIAQIVNEARASGEYDDVLLLDGGDIYQGNPVSNLLMGNALRAALDAMDYDAVVLGNHEFDWGVTAWCVDPDATVPAYSLDGFSGDPDIPVLACNLYYAGTGQRVGFTRDYAIVEKAGRRIVLIGFIPDYHGSVLAERIAPYTIDGDLETFAARVREINAAEQPDVTVVLAHAEPRSIAKVLELADVQLVTGGHKHNGIYGISENGVPYIQANCNALGYASATIIVAPDGSVRVEDPLYTPITMNRKVLYDTAENAARLDRTVLSISHAAWEEVRDEMGEVLGYIDTPIRQRGLVSDNGATSAGNWITGLMLRAASSEGVVAAFYNSGGIRKSFEITGGDSQRILTAGDIYTIAPFSNTWLVYELTGAELAQQLINGFVDPDYGDQMSGLKFDYVNHGTKDDPDIEILRITLDNGTEVDIHDEKTLYRVCVSNYSATAAGSVFEHKTPLVPVAEAPIDNLTMILLLRQEARDNGGRISVDTGVRGTLVEESAALDDAA